MQRESLTQHWLSDKEVHPPNAGLRSLLGARNYKLAVRGCVCVFVCVESDVGRFGKRVGDAFVGSAHAALIDAAVSLII